MGFKEIKTIEDLNFLKDNKVSEGIDIDYKEKLPELSVDESRLDFLRDICSFANTHGGQLIYGIREERGKAIPQEITGVDLTKPDHDVRKIIEIVREGLDVTLAAIRYTIIPLPNSKYVVVINIPTSMTPPHRVKVNLDKDHRFYGRNDRARYELSFEEIRDKFMQSTTIREKVRAFRAAQIQTIQGGHGPIELPGDPVMVLHIIPLTAFSSMFECSSSEFKRIYSNQETYSWFAPFGYEQIGTKNEINLEGFLSYNTEGYVQFYREGIIEAVSHLPRDEGHTTIHSGFYESYLLKQNYFKILKKAQFTPPFCIFLSVLWIREYSLAYASGAGRGVYNISPRKYNKSEILLREVILESYESSLPTILRPLYDRLCNAWGLPDCKNYNQDGTYKFEN